MEIDPNKTYSLNEILETKRVGLTQVTVLKKVLEDKLTDDILQVEITGTPHARRYKIKGRNLLRYLKYHGK